MWLSKDKLRIILPKEKCISRNGKKSGSPSNLTMGINPAALLPKET
jgi:hypothetical protein